MGLIISKPLYPICSFLSILQRKLRAFYFPGCFCGELGVGGRNPSSRPALLLIRNHQNGFTLWLDSAKRIGSGS
jgi:hypothetical protein